MTSFTIDEFCGNQRISRAYYYVLVKRGRAPRSFKLGRTTRISEDAVVEWVKAREAESRGAAV